QARSGPDKTGGMLDRLAIGVGARPSSGKDAACLAHRLSYPGWDPDIRRLVRASTLLAVKIFFDPRFGRSEGPIARADVRQKRPGCHR
ncbi:MAG TPA: hypothetical protein P5055_17790, partial [Candidatus Paceibacterota bacterium]|nr:hypothetical protein [Candidatus Paceibacterota bacterium]